MPDKNIGEWTALFMDIAIFCLIPIAAIVLFLNLRRHKKSEHSEVKQDVSWQFGDEWKNQEEQVDVTDWEEILTIPRGNTSMYDLGLDILARKPLDINQMQSLLTENQIVSKILPSQKSTSPSDGLFVEKKFAEEARRILNINV